MNGERLIYAVGIADIKELTGIEFDFKEFKTVPQYLYMGSIDDNDPVPHSDCYGDEEREIFIRVIGQTWEERWEKAMDVYKEQNISAIFKTYPNVWHTITDTMQKDVINFLKSNIK